MTKRKKNFSVTRGYRLSPETHYMIKSIKDKLRISHDKILNDALKSFYFKSGEQPKTIGK